MDKATGYLFDNKRRGTFNEGPLPVSPTLEAAMGTGGGNIPIVVQEMEQVKVYDARGNGDGKTTNAIVGGHEDRVTDYTTIIVLATQQGGAEIMINKSPSITAAAGMSGNNQPVICLQGNGIDRADTAGCNGKGWNDAGVRYTLNTIDRPAVAYASNNTESFCIGNGQVHDAVQMEREKCKTLNCMEDPMKVLIRKV